MNKKNNLTILAVDLNHTLIKTDMIHLGIKYILKYKILLVISLLITFIFKGKPGAKKFLYDNTIIDITKLPYNNDVISYINISKQEYDLIILISGSYYKYVQLISNYLNIFDEAVGTTDNYNMISFNKVTYLRNKYPNVTFDYIGDSKKDIPIWNLSRKALVVKRGNILRHIKNLDFKVISHIN